MRYRFARTARQSDASVRLTRTCSSSTQFFQFVTLSNSSVCTHNANRTLDGSRRSTVQILSRGNSARELEPCRWPSASAVWLVFRGTTADRSRSATSPRQPTWNGWFMGRALSFFACIGTMNRFVLVLVVLVLESKPPNRGRGRERRRGRKSGPWKASECKSNRGLRRDAALLGGKDTM